MKAKIPTDLKTKLTTCPFCGRNAWSKKLSKCKKCRKEYTPDLPYWIDKASNLK